ncbi:transportin-3 [Octopus sinensis]|uniref:Transportin-3 n=1 Tax=Octopus sinensis TaxID=2607531 RepID=A0A6P7T7G3_9MOLL|nr:transportin-3 [Octopus sinensis]
MESPPPLETVHQALQALYNNPDVSGKENASVWLGELQRSVFAWQVADQLLTVNRDLESCYFAAQTMRTKIQCFFHELPASSHSCLRDSLLNHASKINPETAPVIVTQLSLAVADLALQMGTWKRAVVDLIERYGQNAQQLPFLLEVLTVLPEEIGSKALRLGANRRMEVSYDLLKTSPVVVQLLTACIKNNQYETRLQMKIFRCLGSWFNINAVSQEEIVNSAVLHTAFHVLSVKDCPSNLHEAAADCICSALCSVEELGKNLDLAKALFQGVLTLQEAYHISVAQEDADKTINYCRIFAEMAESFLPAIISSPNQGLGDFTSLDLLLTCVGHHLYEVAEITFNFWYRLSEELYHKNDSQMNEIFRPYIQRLIVALCRHCQLEPDHEGVPDESSDFGEFRTRVSELTKDIIFIVGPSVCFTQMFTTLQSQSVSSSWDIAEAGLFLMTAVAKNVSPDENDVPQVIEAMLSLPADCHVAVRYTSIQLIGELCEWIEKHPHLLDPVLQFLLAGLQQSLLASVSATALQSICTACRSQMREHFDGLLQIAQAMDSFNLSNDAAIGLLKGTATILTQLPYENVGEGLKKLCSFQLTPLNKLINEGEVNVKQGSSHDPTLWLDGLAAIFRHLNPSVPNGQPHPCQSVIQEIFPVLSQACDKYQSDVRIVERCCRCIRFAIRCLGKNSASVLQPLVTQMVTLYQVHQHSCFLYLGSILVDEYGTDPNCVPGLLNMLQAFCTPAFKQLEEHNGLRNHPDTVDDLFRLCLRFVQRAPVAFLQCQMSKAILCCSIAACSLDHRDANASVMKFLEDLINCATAKEHKDDFETRRTLVEDLLREHGQTLVHSLLNTAVYCLPTYMVSDVADVIYELMLFDRPTFCQWLEVTLKSLPTESSGGTITATHTQLTEFHKAVTSAESVKQVCNAVKEFARLFRN